MNKVLYYCRAVTKPDEGGIYIGLGPFSKLYLNSTKHIMQALHKTCPSFVQDFLPLTMTEITCQWIYVLFIHFSFSLPMFLSNIFNDLFSNNPPGTCKTCSLLHGCCSPWDRQERQYPDFPKIVLGLINCHLLSFCLELKKCNIN